MRYAGQIYNQLVDKETRSKFSNNLYIQLYKSGYAVVATSLGITFLIILTSGAI